MQRRKLWRRQFRQPVSGRNRFVNRGRCRRVTFHRPHNYSTKCYEVRECRLQRGATFTAIAPLGGVAFQPSVAIPADGLPVISYRDDEANSLRFVKCGNAACSTGNQTSTLIASGRPATYSVVRAPLDGRPIVAYLDINLSVGSLKLLKCGNSSCTSGNTVVAVDNTGDVGYYVSMVVPADNRPLIVYYDRANQKLKTVKCGDTSCSNNNVITTLDSAGSVGQFSSVALAVDQNPIVSYFDYTNWRLKVAKCGNSACTRGNTISVVDDNGDVGLHTSIVVPPDGLPAIFYYDSTNTNLKMLKCSNAWCLKP